MLFLGVRRGSRSHVGESPTGRIRRFTTERDVRKEAARLNLQAGHLLNQQAITKVMSRAEIITRNQVYLISQ